jgi:hypothetical protein
VLSSEVSFAAFSRNHPQVGNIDGAILSDLNDRADARVRELMMWMHGPKLIVSTQDSTETSGARVRGWRIRGDRHEG